MMAFNALQQEALETLVALSDQAKVRPPSTLLHFGHGDRSCPVSRVPCSPFDTQYLSQQSNKSISRVVVRP